MSKEHCGYASLHKYVITKTKSTKFSLFPTQGSFHWIETTFEPWWDQTLTTNYRSPKTIFLNQGGKCQWAHFRTSFYKTFLWARLVPSLQTNLIKVNGYCSNSSLYSDLQKMLISQQKKENGPKKKFFCSFVWLWYLIFFSKISSHNFITKSVKFHAA